MAGWAVSIAITEVGAPFAICTVAVVLIVAAVVCWAIMDPERSTRLTADERVGQHARSRSL
jgi:hypothetical protein